MTTKRPPTGAATVLGWIGALGIMTIVIARCLIVFAPQVLFDVDPAREDFAAPLGAYGPVGSLALDIALLASCAIALAGEALAKRRIDWLLYTLALLPAGVVWIHGIDDAGDLWRGMTWVAAALACVTVAHLARERRLRLLMIALGLAVVLPLLCRGAMQVSIEHDATVASFEANKNRYFAERGWEPDSPSALIYERRLRQRQPTGWFPTTNILASFLALGFVAWLGLAFAAARARLSSGWWGTAGLVALLAAIMLVLCGSKGAILATGAGLAVLVAPQVARGLSAIMRRRAGLVLVGLVVATLVGIVMRGLLPESFLNDRSLLFRWHYLVGAMRMIGESPLPGVGPDGFQAAYVLHRLPRSPEEVSSAHSMLVDWLAMLGAAGLLWTAMVVVMLLRTRGGSDEAEPAPPREPSFVRAPGFVGAGVAAAVMLIALPAEWHTLDLVGASVRLLGAGALALLAAFAALLMDRCAGRDVRWALVAALAALLVHGQIEMTFFQPGSVAWAMVMIGLVGGVRPGATKWAAHAAAGVVALLILVTAWLAYRPALVQAMHVRDAAALLWPPADDLSAHLEQRRRAADLLAGAAYPAWPANRLPLRAAAEQALLAAAVAPGDERIRWLEAAAETADQLADAEPTAASLALRAGTYRQLAMTTGDEEAWDEAIADAERITELDPHAAASWKRLGDLRWEAGRPVLAARAYGRALECSDNFELDPLKQLSPRDRAVIESRIAEAGSE